MEGNTPESNQRERGFRYQKEPLIFKGRNVVVYGVAHTLDTLKSLQNANYIEIIL